MARVRLLQGRNGMTAGGERGPKDRWHRVWEPKHTLERQEFQGRNREQSDARQSPRKKSDLRSCLSCSTQPAMSPSMGSPTRHHGLKHGSTPLHVVSTGALGQVGSSEAAASTLDCSLAPVPLEAGGPMAGDGPGQPPCTAEFKELKTLCTVER